MPSLDTQGPRETSQLASVGLAFANLDSEQKAIVCRCINNYAQADTVLGKVMQQLYFFLEAIRSLRGNSDWQNAQSTLEDKAFSLLPSFTRSWIGDDTIHRVSNSALRGLVRLNESEIGIPNSVTEYVEKNVTVDKVVEFATKLTLSLIFGNGKFIDEVAKSGVQAIADGLQDRVKSKTEELSLQVTNRMVRIASHCAERAISQFLPNFATA